MSKRQVDLKELVFELQSQNKQKRDIILPAKFLSMERGKIVVNNPSSNPELSKILYETGISETTEGHTQRLVLDRLNTIDPHLVGKLEIPTRYFDKCDNEEDIALLDANVNHWLQMDGNILLRTFVDKEGGTGVARALLSDKFRMIDNYDILLATLQAVEAVRKETGIDIQLDEKGADVSDKRLYLRFIAPQVEIDSPNLLKHYRPNGSRPSGVGNGIISGFAISNSEVGFGQFSIAARAKILVCGNGMVSTSEKFKQRHLGAKMEEFQVWSEESRTKNLELVIAQIKDSVREYVSADCLGRVVADLEAKAGYEVKHPGDCIKQVSQSIGISDDKADEILNMFIKSSDVSALGVVNAFTLYAHTKADADLQFDIENKAMEILETVEDFDKPLPKKTTKAAAQLN
jgi:hypothetical protein